MGHSSSPLLLTHLVFVLELENAHDRSEYLLLGDGVVILDVGEDRGLHEVPAPATDRKGYNGLSGAPRSTYTGNGPERIQWLRTVKVFLYRAARCATTKLGTL